MQPESEAALEIVRQALLPLDMPSAEIIRFKDAIRRELYEPPYQLHIDVDQLRRLKRASQLLGIEWVTLPRGSSLLGKSAMQAEVRKRTGASIVTVLRGDESIVNPGPDVIFREGDVLAVLGTPTQQMSLRAVAGIPNK